MNEFSVNHKPGIICYIINLHVQFSPINGVYWNDEFPLIFEIKLMGPK